MSLPGLLHADMCIGINLGKITSGFEWYILATSEMIEILCWSKNTGSCASVPVLVYVCVSVFMFNRDIVAAIDRQQSFQANKLYYVVSIRRSVCLNCYLMSYHLSRESVGGSTFCHCRHLYSVQPVHIKSVFFTFQSFFDGICCLFSKTRSIAFVFSLFIQHKQLLTTLVVYTVLADE